MVKGVHVELHAQQILVSNIMHCRQTFSDSARLK